ncbi:MAG TPA: aspartate/glutamate racemase family protein [Burkholderiales bacterium]|nr:aspartate/glutamate racemase family protein [Burkholderiales bacterium]
MKIWYQSLFDAGRVPAYFDGVRKRIPGIARPGTEVHLHSMPEGVYGGRTPAECVIYPYVASLHAQIILDNALRAQAEGYDVFALSSVQDPALEEARALLDIPVVGYGEAAMHFACLLGSRFVIIVFGERFDQMLDLRVKQLGLSERALPTLQMERTTFGDVEKGLQDATAIVEAFRHTARKAIALGAEAIIPGQLYLSEAIVRAGVTRIDEVPIVDGLAAVVKMAEVMADFKKLGISVTRRGYTHAQPPQDVLEQARKFHRRT